MVKTFLRKCKSLALLVFYRFAGNDMIKKTQWYRNMFVDFDHQIFPGNVWYREHDERNFDLVNLGSSGGKWAFDYSDFANGEQGGTIKAMNWAWQPQTLQEDYNLLRHYHSILRKGGYVLITIMPFTGLNKKTGLKDAMKYVRLDYQGEAIQPYMYEQAKRYSQYPMLMGKPAFVALVKYILGREDKSDRFAKAQVSHNPMTEEQLDSDALGFINGWKKQFGISDFEAPLTPQNQEGREYRIQLMRELVDFCVERSYTPVYVIPPVTKHLSRYYTPKFESLYIYDYLNQVDRDVLTLDYSKEESLCKDDLYFNSFFMNRVGRKLFTRRVLSDLNLIS